MITLNIPTYGIRRFAAYVNGVHGKVIYFHVEEEDQMETFSALLALCAVNSANSPYKG